MSEDDKLERLGRRAGELLRTSAEQLDGATRSRLARARAAAVEGGMPQRAPAWRYLAPAGAMASAALVAIVLVNRVPDAGVNDGAPAALYDLELLADADALELSEESDLEFIEWAAGMAELEGAGG